MATATAAAAAAEETKAAVSLLDSVKELYENPDKFMEIAVRCNTQGIDARTHDWFRKYPYGLFVTDIKLSSEYIQSHPQECFIRSMLADASMCEGRGRDVFKGIPKDKREGYLREKIIGEYIIPKELRLIVPDKKDFLKLFGDYTAKNRINADKREKNFLRRLNSDIQKADIIDLGGSDETDHLYYLTSGDMVYIINFGEWKASERSGSDRFRTAKNEQ